MAMAPSVKSQKDGEFYSDSISKLAYVGRENLSTVVPPSKEYEGHHVWDPSATWTPEEERRVRRKIDFRLLTMVCLMFLGLQIDRGNLSNALVDNLLPELGLTTNDYNNGTTIQLIGFICAELPIQALIKRFGFKTVLPLLMLAWGLVSTFQAFMVGRVGFFITRALIGFCEGGFVPGAVFYCSYWYTSRELAIRFGFFWATLNVGKTVSALLAAGILEMRGVGGWSGWRWLFVIDGVLTVLVAFLGYLALPQSPVSTKGPLAPRGWFTPAQEIIAVNRILRDDPAKGLTGIYEPLRWRDIKDALLDRSLWGMYAIGLVAYIPPQPVQNYLSLTLKNLGFSTFNSNMLAIPSAVLQIILMLLLAFSSDYFGERTLHGFLGELWILPCLVALQTLPPRASQWSRFTVTTLVAGYPYFHPIVVAWISENSFNVRKRAVAAAIYNILVQVGSVVSSQIFRENDAAYYSTGTKVLIALCILSLLLFIGTRVYLNYLNAKKARVWSGMSAKEQKDYQADTAAREVEGNKRLDFMFKF